MKGKLTRPQFDLLVRLATPDDDHKVAPMATETVFDAPLYENTRSELTEMGLIEGKAVTAAGFAALEPYRARRVILTAAGFGKRLVPVTLQTPKPLVTVHGKRLIETIIDAALAAGIEEIIVIRGYLGEQFDALCTVYPSIRLIDNPYYRDTNNISSVYLVADLLENAYVCDADLFVKKTAVFKKYHWCSNCLGVSVARTDNWCFTVQNNVVVSHHLGGEHCWQEIGVAYLDASAGKRAAAHIRSIFAMPEGKNYFWGNALFTFFAKEYHMEIRRCISGDDVLEIDTYEELCALDPSYKNFFAQ